MTFPRAVLGYAPYPQPSPYSFSSPVSRQGLLDPRHTQNMHLQLRLCPSSWSGIVTLQLQIYAPTSGCPDPAPKYPHSQLAPKSL